MKKVPWSLGQSYRTSRNNSITITVFTLKYILKGRFDLYAQKILENIIKGKF